MSSNRIFSLFFLFFSVCLHASVKNETIFSGRVSKINESASLVRVRVDFGNLKYLNSGNEVEFWHDSNPHKKCRTKLLGKSNRYLLLSVPSLQTCLRMVSVTVGALLYFTSKDLSENLQMGNEVVKVLIKKRLAMRSLVESGKKELEGYVEKVEATNNRYQILKDKLDLEWQTEIANLEEDKTKVLKVFKDYEKQLMEIDHKLEIYRVEDQNLKTDRWSLDSSLYYKK